MEKAPEWADLSKGARSKKTVNIPLYVDLLGRILRTAMHDMGFGFETRNFGRAVVADLDLGIGRRCFSPLRVSLTTVVFDKRKAPPIYAGGARSEEHTSELPSLMRISYAVFCLKKKKHKRTTIKLSNKSELTM